MVVRVIFNFVLLLLSIAVSTTADEACKGGAECITLESCTGLYNILLLGPNPQLTKLLKGLHCGFDNINAKICCPPEFKSAPGIGNRDNFPTDPENEEPDSRIPDGQVCGIQTEGRTLAQHPWTALLRYDKTIGWGFFCSGVLITSKYVLTTASCVKGLDLPSNWKLSQVRLGEWNTSSLADCYRDECSDLHLDVPIEKIIVHEKYNPSDEKQKNDIALLRLSQDVQFTDYIKPICLPTPDQTESIEDYVAEVAGWGELKAHSNSPIKLVSAVPVMAASECSRILNHDISETQICAGGAKDSDSCLGDYGGALMGHLSNDSNWLALGLASYRPISCQSPEYPTVYTRVDAYIEWIDQKIEA